MALLMTALMALMPLAGCFGANETNGQEESEGGVFDFAEQLGGTTWYHYPGGANAMNNTSALVGDNIPYFSQGTYYATGYSTFEPTMGITSTDNIYFTSYGNGPQGSTAIVQCTNMIEMKNLSDFSCENVYGPVLPVANSNDPYVYVDPWTDRIMKFDMHAFLGMTVEWSDDEGDSWFGPSVATSYSVQDHQTIASSPYGGILHETLWVFCINGNYPVPAVLSKAKTVVSHGGLNSLGHRSTARAVVSLLTSSGPKTGISTADKLDATVRVIQCTKPKMGPSRGRNTRLPTEDLRHCRHVER